ncbi:zinc-ribbon domain-containing protein [Dictyobacter kobayashii]|uniref:zinc-ribbon domain-containing protein n=1 Tax=Dictyobacter kobayashii TaxID=2014872 RepID=UPI0035317DD3
MLFCQNCRSEVPTHARVCPHCGSRQINTTDTPISTRSQEQSQQIPFPTNQQAFTYNYQSMPTIEENEKPSPPPEDNKYKYTNISATQGLLHHFPLYPANRWHKMQQEVLLPLTGHRLHHSHPPILQVPLNLNHPDLRR